MHCTLRYSESMRSLEMHDFTSTDKNDMRHFNDIKEFPECSGVEWDKYEPEYEADINEQNILKPEDIKIEIASLDSSECLVTRENIVRDFFSLHFTNIQQNILNNTTLGRALKLFDLPNLLKDLDQDLKLVQNQMKSKTEHEAYFNQNVNDKFKQLSRKYHPDIISNKGGSEEDVQKATEMQKAVNSVWGIMRSLHKNFNENNYVSDQNFKYSTCSTVEIAILSNEDRLKHLNNKVLIELCWLSRIKHEKIIPNLNKFLYYSDSSLQGFINKNESIFVNDKKLAQSYFNLYVSGYNEWFKALDALQKECVSDDDLVCIRPTVENLIMEIREYVKIFEDVKKLYSGRFVDIKKLCKRLSCEDDLKNEERGFVLPIAEYSSLLYACNEVFKKQKEGDERKLKLLVEWGKKTLSTCISSQLKNGQYLFSSETEHHFFPGDRRLRVNDDKFLNEYQVREKREFNSDELDCLEERITAKAGSNDHYQLLHNLSSYYCDIKESNKYKTNNLLQHVLFLPLEIHWETSLEPLKVVIRAYAKYLKETFRPIKIFSECDIKDFKKDVEKIVEEFTSTMREVARKGQQEIREQHAKISNELNQMDEKFKAAVKEEENENARKFIKMKEELKKDEDTMKRMLEHLEKEKQERDRIEQELKKDIEEEVKLKEEKLREVSEKADKEREDRISKQLRELEKTMEDFLHWSEC